MAEEKGAKEKIFADLARPLDVARATGKHGPEAADVGQVARMIMPHGFVPGEESQNGSGFYRDYHLPHDADVKIFFNYRGHRASEKSAHAFADILKKPPHTLSPSEFSALSEIVGDRARKDDFTPLSHKTEDVNGKRVLVVEGQYKNFPVRTRSMFVDADSQSPGSVVQEIVYQAPNKDFDSYRSKAVDSFKGILWK